MSKDDLQLTAAAVNALQSNLGKEWKVKGVKDYGSMDVSNRGSDENVRDGCPDSKRQEEWTLVKPDGGWGWLVVLGVALSNMTTQSLISAFGLLFMRRLPELEIDTSGISLILSIQITILNLSGLFTGPLLKKFSSRQVASTGVTLVMLGLFLTGYAKSLFAFICTYSALTGLGIGFLAPSTFVAINSYFSTWRSRAVGLSVTGTGVGQMLLPLLIRYLLEEYSFRGTVLILAGLSSHAFVGAAMYQPVERHMKRKRLSQAEVKLKKNSRDEDPGSDGKSPEVASEKPAGKRLGFLRKIFHSMDWDLMKDRSFVNLIVWLAVVYSANIMFQMLLPFLLESAGHSRRNIAICMSVLSGADIVGRLILPTVTDILRLRTKSVFFLGAGLSAVARSGLVLYSKSSSQIYPTLALAAACGITRSAIICNFNLCVSDQAAPAKLPSALGLHMMLKGISVMLFGPLIGFIRDYSGSYSLSMHTLSLFFLGLPFVSWLMEFVALKRRIR